MKKLSRVLSVLLVAAMLFSMAACQEPTGTTAAPNATNPNPTTGKPSDGVQATYLVTLKTAGGMAMSGIDVYIYEDSNTGDLTQFGKTDANGQVSFKLQAKDNYVVVLSGVPEGYEVKDFYPFTGNNCLITLTSSLIPGKDIKGQPFKLGDVMYDFTVTDPNGVTYTLSEILKEKKMVMLNFWYSTCTWCLEEFPAIENVYQNFSDKMEILALNPYPTDMDAEVTNMREYMGLSFPMAKCDMTFAPGNFNAGGYPTSVFIDRYGVVCLIEEGAIPSEYALTSVFNHFTADDYRQKLCPNGIDDVVSQIKPTDVLKPEDFLSNEQMGEIMTNGDFNVTYRYDENEYSWPFIRAEVDGEVCLKASNSGYDTAYAIVYADVELKAGQAVGFDYIISSQQAADVVYVIVNGKDVYAISGEKKADGWKSCYPWVALEDGVYEVALCYMKDGSTNAGDDTIYIKNLRVIDEKEIDVDSYIPREAATEKEDGTYEYVQIVFNENDGYYHVGSENGPLLLANMMGYSQFSTESSVWMMFYNGEIVLDGVDYTALGEKYAGLSNNSNLNGYCTVDKGLAELLKVVAQVKGFDVSDENEWLKICEYYNTYGSGGTQLEDPIKGLTTNAAYTAQEGKGWFDVETGEYSSSNCFYYNGTPIMPRGKFAEFIPEKSGVYMITSHDSSAAGIVDGWIFKNETEMLCQSNRDYRDHQNGLGAIMIYYMEAGTPYYINMAFYDLYEVGYIAYDIEYLGASYDLFRLASPPTFTYDGDATGDQMYRLIHGGIDVILGDDGYYYHDLGNGVAGSAVYASFTDVTGIINFPIASLDKDGNPVKDANTEISLKGLIDRGAFDFSKTERDQEIIGYIQKHEGDIEATDAYLQQLWGETYTENAALYLLEEVYAAYRGERGYHGKGKDYTEQMRKYINMVSMTSDEPGCIMVNEELAEMLQAIIDKYTFPNVEFAWLKLCYYYEHLG